MRTAQSAQSGATLNNQLIPFDFEDRAIRVALDENGVPWFHAGDICVVLGYVNPSKTVADHVDSDDLTKREVIDSLGRNQQANYVNESGLYALVFGSTKPEAKRFKRWVTSEVLPAIRQTGGFGLPEPVRQALDEVIQAARQMGRTTAKRGRGPSRSELRARFHGGFMPHQQAIQPIHLEYGQAWTTSLHLAHASDLNIGSLADRISDWVRDGRIGQYDARIIHVRDANGSPFPWNAPVWQMSEAAATRLIEGLVALDGIDDDLRRRLILAGENLAAAFAHINGCPAPEAKSGETTMAVAIARLARLTGSTQGGR